MSLPPISAHLAIQPVSRFMKKELQSANTSSSIRVAMEIMLAHHLSGIPVIDPAGHCVGMFSEMDAIVQGSSKPLDSKITFAPALVSVKPESTFKDTLILLVKNRFKRLPVIDQHKVLVGIVSRSDLMEALLKDNDKSGIKYKS